MRFEPRPRPGALIEIPTSASPSSAVEAYQRQERPMTFWLAPDREDRVQLSVAARAMRAASRRAADPRELTQLRIEILRLLVERLTGRALPMAHIDDLGPFARAELALVGQVEPRSVEREPEPAPPPPPPPPPAPDPDVEPVEAPAEDEAEESEEEGEAPDPVEEIEATEPEAPLEEEEPEELAFAAGVWIALGTGQELPVGVELALTSSFLEGAGQDLMTIAELDDRFDLRYPGSDEDIDYADLFYEIDMEGEEGLIDRLLHLRAEAAADPPPEPPAEDWEPGPAFGWAGRVRIWETDGADQRVLMVLVSVHRGGVYLDRRLPRRQDPIAEEPAAPSPLLFGPAAMRFRMELPPPTFTCKA
jgi:hypothetical protein